MQITRRPDDPTTWEFHNASTQERQALGRFMATWDHGTIVNHWEPFLVSFTDARVIEAFEQEFQRHFEQA